MSTSSEFKIFFPDGDQTSGCNAIVQAMNLAGMKVFFQATSSIVPDAVVTWFHGRGRVPDPVFSALKGLSCPIIGIELSDDGNRNDPITLLDVQLDSDTPPAVIVHTLRKQISISKDLAELVTIEDQLNYRKRRLDEIVESGIRLTRTLAHHELFQLVVDRAASVLAADVHALFTIDGTGVNCRLRAINQAPESQTLRLTPSFRIRSDLKTTLGQMTKPVSADHPFSEPSWLTPITGHFPSAQTLLLMPFISKGHLLGFIVVAQLSKTRSFSDAELERFEVLAAFSSVALGNAFVYDQTETLSRIDDLTGTYNFGFIQDFLDRLINAGEPFSLVFIDLDGFKKINLLHGHTAGNRALRQTAAKIRDSLMSSCLSGRFGGDEFVLVIPGKDSVASKAITGKVISAIETVVIDSDIRLSASAGIAEFPSDGDNLNAIIHAADTAMYAAKEQGRGHLLMFRELVEGKNT
ncbi:sensor domain-containing diguanylate cyclase [bacterium]|nr:sensor domain-containing diguanylate cyclase [candidate division CSSED10-310 bacterium]